MGMFDYIKCEWPLPETETPPPSFEAFQTKDTPDQYMTLYTITADGRLTWRPYTMETVPKAERPYPYDDGMLGLVGWRRRVEADEETLPFHGDIEFYTSNNPDVGWWEYRARFTEGRLLKIELVDFKKPEGRNRDKELDECRAKAKGGG